MIRPLTFVAVVSFVALMAAAGGFMAGRQWGGRSDAVAQELRAQREILVGLMESVSTLAENPARNRAPSLADPPAGAGVDGTAIESAVRKAISDSHKDENKQAAPAVPTEQNAKAYSQCTQVLDHALSVKRWTEADAQAWRQNIGQLTAEHADEFMGRLAVAINQGHLVVETDGKIF
jgi:hypothetical protein